MKAAEKTGSKLQKLTELFTGKAYLLVVMQDTPDPDSLAAAVALRRLAKSLANLQCSLAYGGMVGRGENRALVKYLGLNLRPCDEIDYEKYDLVAMVDTQPGTGNNSLPETVTPNIVIDHHPIRRQTRTAAFTDVRSGYGAASTILVEYLIEAGITPDTPLATALSNCSSMSVSWSSPSVTTTRTLSSLAPWSKASREMRSASPRSVPWTGMSSVLMALRNMAAAV